MKDDMKNLPKGLIEKSLEAMRGDVEKPIVVRQDLEEKLHGDQYKLDLNRNGRLDKQDFKHLRKTKQVKEALDRGVAVAQLVQVKAPGIAELDESIGQLIHFDRMRKTASIVIEGKTYKIKQGQYTPVTEQMLDELSKATLTSYASKIDKKIDKHQKTADAYSDLADKLDDIEGKDAKRPSNAWFNAQDNAIEHDTIASNKRSMKSLALAKVKEKEAKELRSKARNSNYTGLKIREDVELNEETEQLDELSKDTLKSYSGKAQASIDATKKKGRASNDTIKFRAKRGAGLEKAKAKLQAIVKKEHEAEMAHLGKINQHLDKHFEDNHHAILQKHGFNLISKGEHNGKNIKTYAHAHDNGHVTMLSIHSKPGFDSRHDWGYKHEVRVVNSKGTSYSAHYPNPGAWRAEKAEQHKNEMMPNFEAHVIRTKNEGASEGHW